MSDYNDWNKRVINEFRENKGKVGGPFENMTLLLLHTIGAKSGKKRINPLATIKEGDEYVIIASKGGAPTNPDWYYNVLAHPEVGVEVGTNEFKARVEVLEEPERTRLYDKVAAEYPGFEDYRRKTERRIPVIKLTPLS